MRFTLSQLESLLWVVRLGSFRAAAARLNVTPPAISVRIRELEAAVGGPLFLRSGYRARPTALGRDIAAHAERVMAAGEELESRFAGIDELRGPVRIGAADTFAMTCLSRLMRELESRHPAARAEIRVDFSVLLNASLQAGDIDIAVLTDPAPGARIAVEPLVDLDLHWVASPKLALPGRTLRPADLAELPVITNPNPSNLYTSLTAWFAAAGLQPSRIGTCNSLMVMTRLAVDGAGISLLPTAILRSELESRSLRLLPVRPRIAPHSLSVAYRRDAPGRALRTLAAMIVELVRQSDLSRFRPAAHVGPAAHAAPRGSRLARSARGARA